MLTFRPRQRLLVGFAIYIWKILQRACFHLLCIDNDIFVSTGIRYFKKENRRHWWSPQWLTKRLFEMAYAILLTITHEWTHSHRMVRNQILQCQMGELYTITDSRIHIWSLSILWTSCLFVVFHIWRHNSHQDGMPSGSKHILNVGPQC